MEKAIVVDLGTFSTKINICGETKPIEERTLSVQQVREEKESTESTYFYGNRGIEEIKNNATKKLPDKVKKPLNVAKYDLISNIYGDAEDKRNIGDFIENVIFNNPLLPTCSGKASNHPILCTDQIMENKQYRSLLSEILFEQLSCPGLYFEIGGVLGLYATGRLDGLIVDMGYSQTSFLPIVQGYCMDHAMKKLKFGGQHLDNYFNHLLRKAGITLHTDYQLEIVRDIKESKAQCQVNTAYEKLQDDEEMNCEKYKMPDGTVLQIGNARYRAPEVYMMYI